jgi:hypothetical protein
MMTTLQNKSCFAGNKTGSGRAYKVTFHFLCLLVILASSSMTASTIDARSSAVQDLNRMPLSFTKNMGQWDERVLFRGSSGGATMWFTKEGVTYQFTRRIDHDTNALSSHSREGRNPGSVGRTFLSDPGQAGMPILPGDRYEKDSVEQLVLTAKFVGANANPEVFAEGQMEYKCNYFIGNDPSKWHADVPNFETITFKDIYPGIDLKYSGDGSGQAAYEFVVAPGADIAQIKVEYEGAEETSIDSDGRLILKTKWGDMIAAIKSPLYSPRPLGEGSGMRESRAVLSGPASFSQLSEKMIGFEAADASQQALGTLAVTLSYSTYLGGGSTDQGYGIAVDGSGNAYVTGKTYSSDFPIQNSFQTDQIGYDVFVTKLSGSGNSLIYSTYLGGGGGDYGLGIAVDGTGNAYVTGITMSTNFPTLNPYQTTFQGGNYDAFVTKLSSLGNSLIYSTYLGGGGDDSGFDIAVDGSGNAYVTGYTYSYNFPTVNPFQSTLHDGTFGGSDAFVTKLSSFGNSLIYSTYLGGGDITGIHAFDFGLGIAVDGSGYAYVTGYTECSNFPTLNPYQTYQGGTDVFVTKLSNSGASLIYSTYLGGGSPDYGLGIAVDGSGNAYVTGWTGSTNFPTLNPFQSTSHGGYPDKDAFVTKLSSTGNSVIYSTYLGGGSDEAGTGIAVDGSGNAYVTGYTSSSNFPTLNPSQTTFQGYNDAFVSKFGSAGNSLIYSTYLGGASPDSACGIAVDGSGNAYVTGYTHSSDFPTLNPYQSTYQGGLDVFVTKIANPVPYNGPVWFVSPGGDDDFGEGSEFSPFRTLQYGINTANPGDTVSADSGAYDPVVINKSLTLLGRNGSASTQIVGLPDTRCVLVNSVVDTVVLDGFTLKNGFPSSSAVSPFGQGGGLLSVGSNVRIANCVVTGNRSSNSGGGLAFRDSSYFEIINTRISVNSALQSGGGIVAVDAKGCKISNTVIDSNAASLNGGGVFVYSSSVNPTKSFELKNCVIAGNTAHEGGTGIGARRNSLSISNCVVYANHASPVATTPFGVYVSAGSLSLHCSDLYMNDQANLFADNITDSSANISTDPLFCDPASGDYHICNTSPCAPANNSCGVLIGAKGIGCYAPTITATAGAGGSISPSGSVIVSCGKNQGFMITAAGNYHIASVLIDGIPVDISPSPMIYAFMNVMMNHTIAATFAVDQYTITASAGSNGSIAPSGVVNVNPGSNQSFTITADANYHIASVLIDGIPTTLLPSPMTYTFPNVTMNHTIAATFVINSNSIDVTVTTNPPGCIYSVDGTGYSDSRTFSWQPGTLHTIATTDGQDGGTGIRYNFANWSDGGTISHTVNPTINTTYTASFTTRYYLTMSASPSNGGTVTPAPPGNWYTSGDGVQIGATTNSGYDWSGWTGTGTSSYTGTDNPKTITMNSPITETAVFQREKMNITVQSSPIGRSISVDDVSYTAPKTFTWDQNTTHKLTLVSPQQSGDSIKYEWVSWSDNGAQTHTVAPNSDTSFTAKFTTKYKLTIVATPSEGGTVTPTSGFYKSDTTIQLEAKPKTGYVFQEWRGTYPGSNAKTDIIMMRPVKDTAFFTKKPVIVCVPESFTFNAFVNGTVPSDQKLQISNSNVSGGMLNWRILTNADWLDVDPVGPANSDSATISVRVTKTALDSGHYSGTLTIESDNASNSPRVVSVIYVVKAVVLQSITISPNSISIAAGDTVRFSASGTYNNGNTSPLSADSVGWTSSDTTIAKFRSPGLVETYKPGTVVITATKDDVIDSSNLTVTAAELRQISITPADTSLPLGKTEQFGATGFYSDGDTTDLTSGVEWRSSNSSTATVDAVGLVRGVGIGKVWIIAKSQDIADSTDLTITAPVIIGITVPRDLNKETIIAAGGTINLRAVCTYSDSNRDTVTDGVEWSSNNTLVATVTDSGIITGIAIGKSYIVARAQDIENIDSILVTVAVALDGSGNRTQDAGEADTIKVKLFNLSSAKAMLFYRIGGEHAFSSGEWVGPVDSRITFTIPGSELRLRGVEYYVKIEADNERFTQPADNAESRPYQLRVRLFDTTSAPELAIGSTQNNYRIIGFPFELQPASRAAVFDDNFGAYDKRYWRLYHWDANAGRNVEYRDSGAINWKEGYWLISRNQTHYGAGGISAVPDTTTSDGKRWAEIHLLKGWNQITTPFAFDIKWDDRNADAAVDSVLEWKPGFSSVETLKPFCGYFVEATANTTLLLSYEQSTTGSAKLRANNKAAKSGWELRLAIRCGETQDAYNLIGARGEASDGYDPSDFGEPPPIGSYVSLAFPGHYPDGSERLLAGDFRSIDQETWEYDMVVRGNIDALPELAFLPVDGYADSVYFELQDAEEKTLSILKPGGTVRLNKPPTEDGNHYHLVVRKASSGSSDLNSTNSSLPVVTLMQNYPNPFNSSTIIEVQLKERTSELEVLITNALGQEVRRMVLSPALSGTSLVNWDGRDESGMPVASGIYFCRVTAGEYSTSVKMVLLK